MSIKQFSTRQPRQVSGDVRRHNLGLVLGHIVAQGPSSRTGIAAGTGLTRGAVTALVGALSDAGILREGPPGGDDSPGRGRPRTLLRIAADSLALLTAQLDAEKATVLVADVAGTTLARFEASHGRPMGDPAAVLDVLAGVLGQALDAAAALGRRVADLTVVAFAPVGGDPAVVLADTDLQWGPVDVLAQLRARLPGLPERTTLTSDAPVAALAEHRLLPGVRDVLYLKSNSGIGGAIIAAGRLLEGGHSMAGALGHVPIDHGGALCECGQYGCLVTVAGPDILLERAGLGAQLRQDGLASALAAFTTRILAGEESASEVWTAAAQWVGRTLQILSLAVDPQVIVLGGYWQPLTAQITAAFQSNRPTIAGIEGDYSPQILPGRLGADAALLGAQWSARDRLLADPLRLAV